VATPQNLSHTDTGLSNGQTYWYKVSAVNSAGESLMSVPASASPFTVPDAPTGVAATPGNGQVTLIWSAPFNGGRPIDYYVVYENGVALANHATELRMVISGLGNGINYSFSVAAHNLAGEGPQSSSVYAIPYTVPGEVTSLVANPGNEQVTLSWSAPLSDGGRPIDYYTVYRNGSALMNVVVTNAWISGLTNGQTYGFTVSAHNVAGEGQMSPTVYAVPATVPTAPTGLTANPGNGTASLSWVASAYDGGRPIDYYIVYMDGTPLTEVTGTSVVIANLQNGRNYTFAVAAHNMMGASQLSGSANAIPFTTATAPRSLEATAGNSMVTLTWSAPLFDGGRGIDHYVIYQDGVMLDANTSSLTVTISGLTNGRQYTFRVAAHSLAGTGTLSDAITAMPATVPSAPLGLTATTAVNKVTLTWQPPSYNGGLPLTGYTIYRNGVPVANVSAATLTWDDTNGTPGTSYRYAVGASNQEGMGLSSVEISASPQADNTWMLLLIVVVVIIVAVVAVLLMRKRRSKK
jgi:titin